MKKHLASLVDHKDAIELLINIAALIISIFGTILLGTLALKADNLSNSISQSSVVPYFEISATTDGTHQTEYVIHNDGGYIVNARISIQSILDVKLGSPYNKDFYFGYCVVSKDVSNLKNDDIVIPLERSDLGVLNWRSNADERIETLITQFEERDLNTSIYYSELLTIKYMDINRDVREEHYLIGVNESGDLSLTLASSDFTEELQGELVDQTIIRSNVYNENTSIEVAQTGRQTGSHNIGGLRRQGFYTKILEVIDAYITAIAE